MTRTIPDAIPDSGYIARSRQEFADRFDVPRETLAKFDIYLEALLGTKHALNLVASSTLQHAWVRHFSDSAQLRALGQSTWLDVGSGAGLPGLVLALLGETVRMVDARAKKVRFIQQMIEQLGLADRASVHHGRIEAMRIECSTIVARALAPVATIFDWTLPLARADTRWVLPKGENFATEVDHAALRFRFDADLIPSITNPGSRIVVASAVRRI